MRRVVLAALLVFAEMVGAGHPGAAAQAAGSSGSKPVISGGGVHTCVMVSSGTVDCWGRNFYGQLGDGTTNNSSTPIPVSGLGGVVAIATGGAHTCAALASGTVECWGFNNDGQLGNGTTG